MTKTHVLSCTSSSSNYSSTPLTPPLLLTAAKRAVHPYLCVICRVLLICAFIDNASQTLLDYTHHVVYLTSTYHVPSVVALLLIAASSMTSFLACTMVFLKPLRRRGIHLLLLCLVYQHVVYGFMSSPSSASSTSFAFNNNRNINVMGYAQQHADSYHQYSPPSVVDLTTSMASLIRTVCLVLTLLLLRTQTKPADCVDRWNRKNNYTLLTTVVNHEQRDRKTNQQRRRQQQQSYLLRATWNVDAIALVSRAMFAVLACQMASLSGVTSMWVVAPMAVAYLFGFMTDFISVFLIAFYVLVTFSTHKFWLVDPSANVYAAFERHALRFEFTHNVSIVSGLVVLFTMGPGALSFDKRFTRQQAKVDNVPSQQPNIHNVTSNTPSPQLVHILT